MQTSYNAKFRGCYAGVGFSYNEEKDIFIRPLPQEYKQGYADFCNLRIPVGEGVYIPDVIAEEFIKRIISEYTSDVVAVDIGAGSANLAIAFSSSIANSKVYAIEPNTISYKWTDSNSTMFDLLLSQVIPLNVSAKDAPNLITEPIDLVFSYTASMPDTGLGADDVIRSSYYSGSDGLDMIREIVQASEKLLKQNGVLHMIINQSNIDELFDASIWDKPEYNLPFVKITKL